MGAIPLARGPFTGFVDLSQGYNFGSSRVDHSGEFNHSLIDMEAYWQQVMIQAGLR